jgi:3-oxocholest-4-en-26-oyl-CoA dehydrogenase alpha subunit
MIDSGTTPYAEASMAKVWYSELRQRLALEALDLMGPEAQLQRGEEGAPEGGQFERSHRSSTVFKLGAGTNEVQRTIIAQQALDLPGKENATPWTSASPIPTSCSSSRPGRCSPPARPRSG